MPVAAHPATFVPASPERTEFREDWKTPFYELDEQITRGSSVSCDIALRSNEGERSRATRYPRSDESSKMSETRQPRSGSKTVRNLLFQGTRSLRVARDAFPARRKKRQEKKVPNGPPRRTRRVFLPRARNVSSYRLEKRSKARLDRRKISTFVRPRSVAAFEAVPRRSGVFSSGKRARSVEIFHGVLVSRGPAKRRIVFRRRYFYAPSRAIIPRPENTKLFTAFKSRAASFVAVDEHRGAIPISNLSRDDRNAFAFGSTGTARKVLYRLRRTASVRRGEKKEKEKNSKNGPFVGSARNLIWQPRGNFPRDLTFTRE